MVTTVSPTGVAVGFSLLLLLAAQGWIWHKRQRSPQASTGVLGLIGQTPLIKIESLSKATKCSIYAKAEFLNPGGSIKDRIALHMVRKAESSGALQPGGLITEGTAGSTGVSLSIVASALGYRCHIFMPDDAAVEKSQELLARGAQVTRVRPVAISHPDHMVNQARRHAAEAQGFFADQFENLDNAEAHLQTGEEIWAQCRGQVSAFVCGAGTGGTMAGVGQALKRRRSSVKTILVDPPGSSLFLKVKRGVLFTPEEAEGKRLKNPFDTVTEGVGLNRLTANFASAPIDDAVQCSDQEAVDMARFLLQNEGLWVGSSSAVNCVGAVKSARMMGPRHTIVTILCDGGHRHLSKFYNRDFLESQGIVSHDVAGDSELLFIK